jgi:hypothetical protein
MPHVPGHNPGTGQDVVGTGGTYVPYKPPVQQLQEIQSQSETTEDQAGQVFINPNVVGDVFQGVDPNTIPYSQMNEAQKVFADFYGSSTPNLYQQQIQDFISASPVNMQVYADSGLKGAGFNKFMTTFPEAVANNSLLGNVISGITSGAGQAKDFVGGLFPGDSTDLQNLVDDFASVPGGFTKDLGNMLGINKDLQPGVGEVREELGVKKQTANDIVETNILNDEGYNMDFKKSPLMPVEISDVAAQIMNPTPDQILKEFYATQIQNAIDFPNTAQAKKLKQLGLVK